MAQENDQVRARRAKVEALRGAAIEPYAQGFIPTDMQ